MLARGMAAAALFALPIGVAAAIGFEGSVSGLTGGLGSLASGPDTGTQTVDQDRNDSLDTAIATIASGPGDGGPGDAAGANGGGGSGEGGGSVTGPVTGVTDDAPQATTPTGGGQSQGPVGLPGGGGGGGVTGGGSGTGGANPVTQLLDDVNNTLTGLLGGGQ
jgi:hypothetical protein